MKPLAPRMVFAGRYEIIALIGRGGMGQVYRALHLGLRKEVALKILGASSARDFEIRFEREARAIARLDHPGCVRVLDHGRTPGGLQFIAMDLLDGATLAATLLDGPLSTSRAVNIARSLLAALAHAHARGVLHRDVKPENVVLVGARTVLIDFGLACLRDEPAVTGSGMCLGSPSYIAPERLLGQPYDARADLYAVGVLLYEMLAGVRPFAGSSPEAIMRHALSRPSRPLRALRRDLPPLLDAIVRRALAKDPARRFADAEDMLLALADVALDDATPSGELARREEQTTVAQISIVRRSLWSRLWARLRYGRWRWLRA